MAEERVVRFAVNTNGYRVELFSVLERNKDLTMVFLRSPPISLLGGGDNPTISDQHFSIHETTDKQNTLVTLKQTFTEGPPLDRVSMIHKTTDYLLWPIVCRRVGVSNESLKRAPSTAKKEQIRDLGSYCSHTHTMFFGIFAAKNSFVPDNLDDTVSYFEEPFEKFKIVILTSYLKVASIPGGDITSETTSAPSFGKDFGKPPPELQRYAVSIENENFIPLYARLIGNLRVLLLEKFAAFFEIGDFDNPKLQTIWEGTLSGEPT